MSAISPEVLYQLDELQNKYVAALDSKDIKGWSDTFTKDKGATYICRSAENESMDLPIALMYDDCRARIEDRITFITKVWKGTFQDYRTRHFTQRISVEQESENTYKMRSNFSIEYTQDPHASANLAAGVYEDVITLEDGEAKFLSRRAVYDTTVLPQYIVYPF